MGILFTVIVHFWSFVISFKLMEIKFKILAGACSCTISFFDFCKKLGSLYIPVLVSDEVNVHALSDIYFCFALFGDLY